MDESTDTEVLPMSDEVPDPEYMKITEEDLAKIKGRRAQPVTPPPNPLAPQEKADNMAKFAGATFLFGTAGPLFGLREDLPAFKIYLDSFLKDAGSPTDPVERLLLEQLFLGHHAAGRLHFRAGTTENLEAITAYLAAAARLMAECRRTTLALQGYREAANRKPASDTPRRSARTRKPASAINGAKIDGSNEQGSNSHNRLKEYFDELEPALS